MAARQLGRLVLGETALFICDIQEKFRPVIAGMPAVIDTARRLIRGASELQVPVVVTEQYPKALGSTCAELAEVLPPGTPVVAKTDFSMLVREVHQHLQQHPCVRQVLLVGIEAHVCVLQTTLDLVEQGYEVHVVVDGTSSQRPGDRAVAMTRMAQAGAMLATSEMVLMQLIKGASHPQFKAISKLIKESRPDPLPILSNL